MTYIDPRAKLLQHIDRIAEIKAGGKPAPVNVEIDLSNRCNLGCSGCHFGHTHTRGPLAKSAKPQGMTDVGDLMPYPLIVSILDQLKAAGVRSITWTGGGEPTLHPHFVDAIMHAQAIGLEQGVYTNGTQIDQHKATLMKHYMAWVYVSMDAHDPESYRKYKRVDAFAQACDGVKHLVKAAGKATIGVGFLIHQGNWDRYDHMRKLGATLGADYVNFRPEINYQMGNPSQRAGDYPDWMSEFTAAMDNEIEWNGLPGVEVDVQRFRDYQFWHGHGYPTCYWAQMQTVITPNGKVWTCVNRRGFSGDCIGDLAVETFADIWIRSAAKAVDHQCRIMCRGHIPNQALAQMLSEQVHGSFI